MFPTETSDEARKWIIWFVLKANLVIVSLFLLINGFLAQSILIVMVALILFAIGGVLVYRDTQTDPYQMLRLMKIQTLLWWRLRGPLISRQPFIYHFPEGSQFQQHHLTRTVSVLQRDLTEGSSILRTVKTAQLCPECGGKRSKPMTVQIECSHCQDGRQMYSLKNILVPTPCKHCLGVGWIPVHPCENCRGKGSVWQKQRIRVQIPSYSSAGIKLRIPVLGRVNPKTLQQGDLYLKLRRKLFNIF